MNEQKAISIIYEGIVGEDGIPAKLHAGYGIDKEQLEKLKEALLYLNEKWKNKSKIPKKVAYALVDVGSAMTTAKEYYSEKQQEEIEDASMEIVELAWKLLDENNV